MGLGKTITCVALIAATFDAARAFAASPLPTPPPSDRSFLEDPLSASHFSGSVWGIPNTSDCGKGKGKLAKAQDRADAEYARACRIKVKSRATLIICPLSTVSNWEDQFREHWRGEVSVVGGGGMTCSAATNTCGPATPPSQTPSQQEPSADVKPFHRPLSGRPLRVYVYHGNARRPDSAFLADFDAVITTYATLASEYSKQTRSIASLEAEEEEDGDSDGGFPGIEIDENGNQVVRLPKPKRAGMKRKKSYSNVVVEATSALQTIHWFRVVLDEAQYVLPNGIELAQTDHDTAPSRRSQQ